MARTRAEDTQMGMPAKTSEADRDAILAALAKGATVSSLAEKFKVSRATIINIRTAGTDLTPMALAVL